MRTETAAVAVLVVLAALAGCGEERLERNGSGELIEAGNLRPDRIRVGDCFDDQPEGEIDAVPAVPCDEPHDKEVFHVFDVPPSEGEGYPGEEALTDLAEEGCLEEFEDFIGIPYGDSRFFVYPIVPSRESWEEFDDREIVCAVFEEGEKQTGSVEGAGR